MYLLRGYFGMFQAAHDTDWFVACDTDPARYDRFCLQRR